MPIISREILSRVETLLYQRHIPGYSSDVLASLTGLRPGQLPGWPTTSSGPVHNTHCICSRLNECRGLTYGPSASKRLLCAHGNSIYEDRSQWSQATVHYSKWDT